MATIKITDNANLELIMAETGPASAFTKYLKGTAAQIVAGQQLVTALTQPLATAGSTPIGLGLAFKQSFELGGSKTELTIAAGLQGLVTAYSKSGDEIFSEEHFGDPIAVPPAQGYLAFTIAPSLALEVGQTGGDLTFGFEAGTSIEMTSYSKFDLGPTLPTVGSALKTVIEEYTIPGDVDDLRGMKEGAVAAVAGEGTFGISGSFDLAAAVNPLATLSLPLGVGPVAVKAGTSLSVGASFAVSGAYQIRIQKTGTTTVRFGLYKKAGSEFSFTVDASLGASVTLGKRDLLKMLLNAISKDPEADIVKVVDVGLSEHAVEEIGKAIEASVNRSLTLALSAEFSSINRDEAAFLYEINLAALDAKGEEAVHHALDGDFSTLTRMETALPAHGITLVRSRLARFRKSGFTWRINLLGIVNVLSISELVRKGKVLYEPISGDLVVSDEISSKKILVVARPFEADGEKLRKLMFESLILTAVWRASRLVAKLKLSSAQTYFEFHQKTNLQTMADNLDALAAVGLTVGRTALPAGINQFGPSTLLLEAAYDDAACRAIFLDAAGKPRGEEQYEKLGRDALIALVRPEDPDAYRSKTIGNDALWKKMKSVGQPNFFTILPTGLNSGIPLNVIIGDYTAIVWWAKAMASASKALADMLSFLGAADPATLKDSNVFRKKRATLEKTLASSIGKNKARFGDPWGLIALLKASNGTGTARGIIVSTRLSLNGAASDAPPA